MLQLIRKIFHRSYSYLTTRRLRSSGKKSYISFPATINFPKSISIGNEVWIREHAWLNCGESNGQTSLQIGDGSYVGRFVHINAYQSVVLEKDVLISDRVFISDVHHNYADSNIPIIKQGVSDPEPIHLKQGCWIGVGASIMPGITIGRNAVVAANAVVTQDIPDHMVARGVPARIYEKSTKGESQQ